MNKRVEIQLILSPDCKLIAIDNENYCDWGINLTKYKIIEFLVYNDSGVIIDNSLKINQPLHEREHLSSKMTSAFYLSKDGTYAYYKLLIPVLELFKTEDAYSGLYQQLYFDNNILYYSGVPNDEEYSYSEILESRKEVTSFLEAYNIIEENKASQSLYCPAKYIFSVCKLQRCLVNLQKELIIRRCQNTNCEDLSKSLDKRDFLLGTLYTLDYLKDTMNFSEAQRLLENISSCGELCDSSNIVNYNDCNCGNTI